MPLRVESCVPMEVRSQPEGYGADVTKLVLSSHAAETGAAMKAPELYSSSDILRRAEPVVCIRGHGRRTYRKSIPIMRAAFANPRSIFWSYGITRDTERWQPARDAVDWLEQRALQSAGLPKSYFVHVSKQQYAEDRRRLDPGWRIGR